MMRRNRKRMKTTLPRRGPYANTARVVLLAMPDDPNGRKAALVAYGHDPLGDVTAWLYDTVNEDVT